MTNKKVLIVESDRWLSEQYQRVLVAAGYQTTVVAHSLAAMQAIDNTKPDVVILDILITGTTAFTLMHELQSYDDTGTIPIIICTNLASDLSLKDLEPYGVKKILDKTKMVPNDMVIALKSVV